MTSKGFMLAAHGTQGAVLAPQVILQIAERDMALKLAKASEASHGWHWRWDTRPVWDPQPRRDRA